MNEALQAKLVEILAGIQSATRAAGDFALEHLPDIAQQYVAYGRAVHASGVVFGVLLVVAAMAVLYVNREDIRDGETFWPIPPSIVGAITGFVIAAINFPAMLLVWLAPKVWLLREIAQLLK